MHYINNKNNYKIKTNVKTYSCGADIGSLNRFCLFSQKCYKVDRRLALATVRARLRDGLSSSSSCSRDWSAVMGRVVDELYRRVVRRQKLKRVTQPVASQPSLQRPAKKSSRKRGKKSNPPVQNRKPTLLPDSLLDRFVRIQAQALRQPVSPQYLRDLTQSMASLDSLTEQTLRHWDEEDQWLALHPPPDPADQAAGSRYQQLVEEAARAEVRVLAEAAARAKLEPPLELPSVSRAKSKVRKRRVLTDAEKRTRKIRALLYDIHDNQRPELDHYGDLVDQGQVWPPPKCRKHGHKNFKDCPGLP